MKVIATLNLIPLLYLTMVIGTLAAPATEGFAPGSCACDNKKYPVICNGFGRWVNAANCDPGQTCCDIGRIPHCFG
ncbi:hypothetical protein BKA64DRAFT_710366 [Cadophora sp. MPI-SDFR-AT-0126]|nr:hypothetical protein BKA64DRAFT_710366 [Leotiomycetes sp. MPI-SDFR-AT-0126]